MGDTSGTPVQFIYEPADCRIWYERQMLYDVTAMWEKVYDVTWGGGACVVGSVKGKRGGEGVMGRRGSAAVKSRNTKETSRKSEEELEELEKVSREVWTDLRHWRRGDVADGVMLP